MSKYNITPDRGLGDPDVLRLLANLTLATRDYLNCYAKMSEAFAMADILATRLIELADVADAAQPEIIAIAEPGEYGYDGNGTDAADACRPHREAWDMGEFVADAGDVDAADQYHARRPVVDVGPITGDFGPSIVSYPYRPKS